MARENVTGQRIVAALIDVAVLAAVFTIMVFLIGDRGTTQTTTTGNSFRSENTQFNFNLTGWGSVAYLLLVAAYYIVTEGLFAGTPGKLVMGLRVVSLDGEPLSTSQVLVRNVLRIIDGLPFLYLVGLITVAVSKQHQRVGDMAAKTTVARAREVAPTVPFDDALT